MIDWRLVTVGGTLGLWASWCAGMFFAFRRGFAATLGVPLFHWGVWPIYSPWAVWGWVWRWGWGAPEAFSGTALVFGGMALGGAVLWCYAAQRKSDARWSTRREL